MKKYLLIVAVLLFATLTAKAAGYSIYFTRTTVYVPYYAEPYDYMPTARVVFPSGSSIVPQGIIYDYGVGNIKLSQLYGAPIGEYKVLCRARSDEYDVTCTEEITVVIRDETPPKINCMDEIAINYGEEFNIHNYATFSDNYYHDITIGCDNIDTKVLGTKDILLTADDPAMNRSQKTIHVTVYDNVKPVLEIKKRSLDIDEGYNFLDNVVGVNDNHTLLTKDNVKVCATKKGNNYYQITYSVEDESGNIVTQKAFANYLYDSMPVIRKKDIEEKDGKFDPLMYVEAYDSNVDITDKIEVIETNEKEKYCIYEVCGTKGIFVREKIYFDKFGNNNKLVFPVVDEKEEILLNSSALKSKNKKWTIVYIGIGATVLVAGFVTYKIVKHFKKKNDIIKSE